MGVVGELGLSGGQERGSGGGGRLDGERGGGKEIVVGIGIGVGGGIGRFMRISV